MITLESSNTIAPPSAKSSNPKGRTLRSNRVYGKRKVNAATAVLEGETTSSGKGSLGDKFAEPNSPALNELVRNVQIKLSEIKIEEHSPNKADNEKKPRIAVEIRRVVVPAQEDGIKNNCTGPVKDYIPEAQIKEGTYCHGEAKKLEPTKLKLNRKERQKKVSKNEAQHGDDVIIEKYVAPILQEATSVKNLENFNSWANRAGNTFDVEKIAEGSYGEVYQLRVRNDLSKKEKAAKLRAFDNGVFKIVPLRAQRGPGSKKFTPIHEVVAEVQMLKLLDPIPGFARFRDVHVVQGRLPTAYQAAWLHYSRTRDDCYNPDPSKKKSYPDNQLWAILEMDNAGYELEKFDCSSIFQIYDIFWGVALSLARAEQFACFEHRDLHLGNICVKSTRPSGFLQRQRDKAHKKTGIASTGFGLSGIETTIIDYSLSRANLISAGPRNLKCTAWSDLDSKKLFDAIGNDDDERLLRDTYRLMRMEVYRDQDPEWPRDEPWRWKEFCPRTNLLWLSFLLTMLLSKGQSRGILPEPRQPLTTRSVNCILGGGSDNSKLGGKLKITEPNDLPGLDFQLDLLDRLQTVLDILNPDVEAGDKEILFCTTDLVAFAIGSRWLDESDFLC